MRRPSISRLSSACHKAAMPSAILLLAILAAGCSGKGVGGSCPDITACGGDPSGSWRVQSVCQFEVPPQPVSETPIAAGYTTPQTPELAAPHPSNIVSGDWCQALDFMTPSDPTMAQNVFVLLNAQPLDYQVFGTMTFDSATGDYVAGLRIQHDFETHFTPACIQAHGTHPSCEQLTASISSYLSGGFVNYNKFICGDASDGGCDCTYNFGEGTGETARYQVVGNQIYVLDAMSGKPPHSMDFCVNGDTMTVGGHNGSHLLGSPGLRSLVLTRCSGQSCNPTP